MLKDNWNELKGYGAIAIGFITCPCHLPITLPIAISLTAGTAAGAWLTNNTALIWGIFTVLFVGGFYFGFQMITKEEETAPRVEKGPKSVLVLSSSTCSPCEETIDLWKELITEHGFNFQVIDINSRRGRKLAGEKNILSTPVTFINGKIKFRGMPPKKFAIASVKSLM